MGVYKSLRLHQTPDRFILEPTEGVGHDQNERLLLSIDRLENRISVVGNDALKIPGDAASQDIYGIMGVIHLLAGPYLIVISKAEIVGRLFHSDIYRMVQAEVIPFAKSTRVLSDQQIVYENTYRSMLESMLETGAFHFSYSYDITHTLQRLSDTDPNFFTLPLHERADRRFYWNYYLQQSFVNIPNIRNFLLPVTHGFFSINSVSVQNKHFDFILITRRSCRRSGTRYNVRGIDPDGNVGNFAETEQIVCYDGRYASFVQTRGSIPLYWTQLPNIKYKPKPIVAVHSDHVAAARAHFEEQHKLYGRVVAVNLIDQKGSELALGKKFEEVVNTLKDSDLRYIAFDFHKECAKMRWDRLSLLLDKLQADIEKHSYFMLDKNQTVTSKQTGTVRTNCVDCLDRTNVVQSLIARYVLTKQLRQMNVLTSSQEIRDQTMFEFKFNNVWADNADAVSVHYSGTGALKTDFTRTGKRTKAGLLQDGRNSAVRYWKNNFMDGQRQDAVDLFLGVYEVHPKEGVSQPSPLARRNRILLVPVLIFTIAMVMLLMSIYLPASENQRLLYIAFWLLSMVLLSRIVIYYGPELVDSPKLTPPGMAAQSSTKKHV